MKEKLGLLLALLMVVALIAITGCSPAAPAQEPAKTTEPAKAPRVVKLWGWLDMSGPLADYGTANGFGFEDYIKYVNESKPIDGVKVEYVWADHASDVAKATSQYKKYVDDQDILGCMLHGTTLLEKMGGPFDEDKLPVFTISSTSPFIKQKLQYPYAFITSYNDQMVGWLQNYIKQDWKGSNPPRIAYFCIDYALGRVSIPSFERICKERGIEYMIEFNPIVAKDTTPQLTRIFDWKPDYVFLAQIPSTATIILNDATRLGLPKEKFYLAAYAGASRDVGNMAQENCVGAHRLVLMHAPDPDKYADAKFWTEMGQKWRPGHKLTTPYGDEGYLAGLNWARWAVETVRQAAKTVGADKLDREAVHKACAYWTESNYPQIKMDYGLPGGLKNADDRIIMHNALIEQYKPGRGIIFPEQVGPTFECPVSGEN